MLGKIKRKLKRLYLSMGSGRNCPICGWTGHGFERVVVAEKLAASNVCPSCNSLERHRFAYFSLASLLPDHATKVLHFAPEECIEPWLRRISGEYLSADLMSSSAMQLMDITDLPLLDGSYSLVWCSHVLEHIEDDAKAMSEIFRVLAPGGVAVIMVPIYGATTYEDWTITEPAERLKHFKQEDHVRLYGQDMRDRLRAAGFEVQVMRTGDVPDQTVKKHGLWYPTTQEIFHCTKD
jgi:predicted SAM-dependent methyltransferase